MSMRSERTIHRGGIKNSLVHEQLEEAIESRKAALGVGRLTKLAFVYIPLNFVCAMLGMNLLVFGTRTIPLWVFFMLATTLTFFTVMPMWGAILRDLSHRTVHLRVAARLALSSPLAGFWYLVFSLTHTRDQADLLGDLLRNLITESMGVTTYKESFIRYAEKGDRVKYESLSEWLGSTGFWKGKVRAIVTARLRVQYTRGDYGMIMDPLGLS